MAKFLILHLIFSTTIICSSSSKENDVASDLPHHNDPSWRNLHMSRVINDELMKMLDKEEVLEKMHELLQRDRDDAKLLNQLKNENKVYRDTFVDNVLEVVDKNRYKRSPDEQKDTRVTGDTILHIRSEMSDVIKSETDLNDILKTERKSQKMTAESYVDGIMIHPSKYIHGTKTQKENEDEDGDEDEEESSLDSTKKDQNGTKHVNSSLNSRRKGAEVSDDYDDSIRRKYGQVLKSKREYVNRTSSSEGDEYHQSDQASYAHLSQIEVSDSEVLSELNIKQMLECSLPSDVSEVAWYKDGEKVLIQGRMQLVREKHIVITGVTREDEGRWTCSGKDSHGQFMQGEPLDLVVLVPPSPPYLEVFGRRLDPSNLFLPVKEGSVLKLSCISEGGKPPATLHWDPAPPDLYIMDKRNQEIEGALSNAVLSVKREHHNVSISCMVVHPAFDGPMITSTLLHVHYAPRFSISRIPGFGFPLAEGSAVALKCDVDSNPPSAPQWRKDEMDPPVPQSDDGFLNFTSVLKEHSGWYKCIANHALGNYSSIGYFLNVRYEIDEVTKQSTDIQQAATKAKVEVALGGAVQLQCPPDSFGCWGHSESRAEAESPSGAPKKTVSPDSRMLYQHEGQYKCKGVAQQEAERLKLLRDTNVIFADGPLVRPTNETIIVKEGQSALFEVEVCSSPPPTRLIWLSPERLLHIGLSYGNIIVYNLTDSSTSDCIWARLAIHETDMRHTGEYSLVARGINGLKEALLQLIVQPNTTMPFTTFSTASTYKVISQSCLAAVVMLLSVRN